MNFHQLSFNNVRQTLDIVRREEEIPYPVELLRLHIERNQVQLIGDPGTDPELAGVTI